MEEIMDAKIVQSNELTKNDEVRASLLSDKDYTQRILRKIKENLLNLKTTEGTDRYTGDDDPKLLEDMNTYYMEFFRTGKFPEFKADGGRIGYNVGGEAGMTQKPMNTDQGPKIDFDTLRARLPKEIGDDIVKLISASPEALEDFATIATQQDVDLFNQKYSVNLVLPQEA